MKNKNKLELRMYGLVPYNISPIQQAIQFGHAVVEYGLKYFKDKDYQQWAKNHKTFIILNGGSTDNRSERKGSLQNHRTQLILNKVKHALFYEPDLNDALTAIVFLVEERVFDTKKHIDKREFSEDRQYCTGQHEYELQMGNKQNVFLREFIQQFRLA